MWVRSVAAGPDEAGFAGEREGLDAVPEGEVVEDLADVGLEGAFAENRRPPTFGVETVRSR